MSNPQGQQPMEIMPVDQSVPSDQPVPATSSQPKDRRGKSVATAPGTKRKHRATSSDAAAVEAAAPPPLSVITPVTHIPTAKVSNFTNFYKTGPPRRIMTLAGEEWTDVPQTLMPTLVEAFRVRTSNVIVDIDDAPHMFDFLSMTLFDVKKGENRSVAWIDESDKCYFPMFVCKEKVPLGGGSKTLSSTADLLNSIQAMPPPREVIKDVIVESGLPSDRQTGLDRNLVSELVMLQRGTEEFLSVMNSFLSGMGTFATLHTVVSVHRYSPKAWQSKFRLELFEQQIRTISAQRGDANIRKAWYGTSSVGIHNVLAHGFRKAARPSPRAAYGSGIYFAPESRSFSCANQCIADDEGHQYMLLCRVIMGNMEQIPVGSRQQSPSNPDFCCGVDDLGRPKCYVLWSTHLETHVQPDYVVCFKLSSDVRDYFAGLRELGSPNLEVARPQLNNTAGNPVAGMITSPWASFAMLFLVIENSIPSISRELLCLHCDEYKRHIISRETLIKWVRLIVGDRMLALALARLQQCVIQFQSN